MNPDNIHPDPSFESAQPSILARAAKYSSFIALIAVAWSVSRSVDTAPDLALTLGRALLAYLIGWLIATMVMTTVIWVHRREGTVRSIVFFALVLVLIGLAWLCYIAFQLMSLWLP